MATFRQVVAETMRAAGLPEEELKSRMADAEKSVNYSVQLDKELSPVQEAQVRAYLLEVYAEGQTPEGRERVKQAAQKFREERARKAGNN